MKQKKRIVSIVLVAVICMTFLVIPASAEQLPPEEYNEIVYSQAYLIHQKYGIDIRYPLRADGYAGIGTGTLETLDKTLEYLTPSFVSQLSQYYKNTRDSYLTVRFSYLPKDLENIDINALARFTESTGVIELFIPDAVSLMTMTGGSPVAIAHEFGHAYYQFYLEQYGESNFKQDWSNFQGAVPYSYSHLTNPDRYSFISTYAAVSVEEDFAETFAYAFTSNRAGLGFQPYTLLAGGKSSLLGKKVKYIQSSLSCMMQNTYAAQYNITRSLNTPSSITYRNLPLSGNSLEYIDFQAPHGIFHTILTALKITERQSQWVPEIGGWEVRATNGGFYLVFPGATFVTLTLPKHSHR